VAILGQYENKATATAESPDGSQVFVEDPSHYYGFNPDEVIGLQKYVNDVDADFAPGKYLLVGNLVTWSYQVFNFSEVTLSGISVRDDNGTPLNPMDDVEVCTIDNLAPLAWKTCTLQGQAQEGPYVNIGEASITLGEVVVNVSDPSHYFGVIPEVDIQKSTNEQDADEAPGPYIPVGESVYWIYIVTNTSNVTLTNVIVTDDQEINVDCPGETLAPQQSMTCIASGEAEPDQYTNLGTVQASPPGDLPAFSDSDPSHYFGAKPLIENQKSTNGFDADLPPGPTFYVNQPITWTYQIENIGNVELIDISIIDDNGTPGDQFDDFVVCTVATLDPGETHTCYAYGLVIEGLYVNTANVEAYYLDALIAAEDKSHYTGILYKIMLPLVLR
jgi:hypothetical protein